MVCRSASSVKPYQNTSPTPRKAPPEIRRDKHFLSAYVKIGRRMASLANWVWPVAKDFGYLGSLWLEENSSVGAGRETARTSNTKYDGKWRFSRLKIANTEVSGAAAGRTRATAKERQSAQT
jgi:hypothetical protein